MEVQGLPVWVLTVLAILSDNRLIRGQSRDEGYRHPTHDGVKRTVTFTNKNFEGFVKKNKMVVAAFMLPQTDDEMSRKTWEVHDHMFELAAQILQNRDIVLGYVDMMDSIKLSKREGIATAGTVVVYKDGVKIVYYGHRSPEVLVGFLVKLEDKPVSLISAKKQKKTFDAIETPKVIGYFSKDSAGHKAFVSAAAWFQPHIKFFVVHDAKIAKQLKLKTSGNMLFYKPYEKKALSSADSSSMEIIRDFIFKNKRQFLRKLSLDDIHSTWTVSQEGALFLSFLRPKQSDGAAFFRILKSVAKQYTDKQTVNFVWVDPDNFPMMLDYWKQTYGVGFDKPSIGHINITDNKSKWFDMQLLSKSHSEGHKVTQVQTWVQSIVAPPLEESKDDSEGEKSVEDTDKSQEDTEAGPQDEQVEMRGDIEDVKEAEYQKEAETAVPSTGEETHTDTQTEASPPEEEKRDELKTEVPPGGEGEHQESQLETPEGETGENVQMEPEIEEKSEPEVPSAGEYKQEEPETVAPSGEEEAHDEIQTTETPTGEETLQQTQADDNVDEVNRDTEEVKVESEETQEQKEEKPSETIKQEDEKDVEINIPSTAKIPQPSRQDAVEEQQEESVATAASDEDEAEYIAPVEIEEDLPDEVDIGDIIQQAAEEMASEMKDDAAQQEQMLGDADTQDNVADVPRSENAGQETPEEQLEERESASSTHEAQALDAPVTEQAAAERESAADADTAAGQEETDQEVVSDTDATQREDAAEARTKPEDANIMETTATDEVLDVIQEDVGAIRTEPEEANTMGTTAADAAKEDAGASSASVPTTDAATAASEGSAPAAGAATETEEHTRQEADHGEPSSSKHAEEAKHTTAAAVEQEEPAAPQVLAAADDVGQTAGTGKDEL